MAVAQFGSMTEVLAAILAALIGLLGAVYVMVLKRLVHRLDEIFARLDQGERRIGGLAERIVRLEERTK